MGQILKYVHQKEYVAPQIIVHVLKDTLEMIVNIIYAMVKDLMTHSFALDTANVPLPIHANAQLLEE